MHNTYHTTRSAHLKHMTHQTPQRTSNTSHQRHYAAARAHWPPIDTQTTRPQSETTCEVHQAWVFCGPATVSSNSWSGANAPTASMPEAADSIAIRCLKPWRPYDEVHRVWAHRNAVRQKRIESNISHLSVPDRCEFHFRFVPIENANHSAPTPPDPARPGPTPPDSRPRSHPRSTRPDPTRPAAARSIRPLRFPPRPFPPAPLPPPQVQCWAGRMGYRREISILTSWRMGYSREISILPAWPLLFQY